VSYREPTSSPRSSDRGGEARLRLLTPCGQITKKQCCWSGALRLGFTSKDPSRIHPDSLPKYACPDLVSQSGFWAKALPEEFANEGNIIAFWVDKKGRVFYRINESAAMLFFSGVRTADPLWALVDVYGLTRGVQLLGEWLPSAPLVAGAGTDLHSHESWWLLVAQEQLYGFPVNCRVLFLATALAREARRGYSPHRLSLGVLSQLGATFTHQGRQRCPCPVEVNVALSNRCQWKPRHVS